MTVSHIACVHGTYTYEAWRDHLSSGHRNLVDARWPQQKRSSGSCVAVSLPGATGQNVICGIRVGSCIVHFLQLVVRWLTEGSPAYRTQPTMSIRYEHSYILLASQPSVRPATQEFSIDCLGVAADGSWATWLQHMRDPAYDSEEK